ncbi:hypothetical protein QVN42_05075 [Yersinia nurmii]|uniref:Fimbrial assembly family protein n=1 Tax=Yersinia nurmii TaxID=685706 RepID=A0AAW7K7K5_9GAMM|nr:hypothetical protein [Yersinia nurmii]MDN0086775.1 hypothetical protein [Yersinia nurmii]CNE23924.1 fimbrial assembly family protein [Yersinia nurmii]
MYQVNFLPWRVSRQQARYRLWRNLLLGHLAMTALILACITFLLRYERVERGAEIGRLSHRQAALDSLYQRIQKRVTELQKLKNHHHRDRQISRRTQYYLVLLNTLSQSMPTDCWITQLVHDQKMTDFDAICRDYPAIGQLYEKLAGTKEKPAGHWENAQVHDIQQRENNGGFAIKVRWVSGSLVDE